MRGVGVSLNRAASIIGPDVGVFSLRYGPGAAEIHLRLPKKPFLSADSFSESGWLSPVIGVFAPEIVHCEGVVAAEAGRVLLAELQNEISSMHRTNNGYQVSKG